MLFNTANVFALPMNDLDLPLIFLHQIEACSLNSDIYGQNFSIIGWGLRCLEGERGAKNPATQLVTIGPVSTSFSRFGAQPSFTVALFITRMEQTTCVTIWVIKPC